MFLPRHVARGVSSLMLGALIAVLSGCATQRVLLENKPLSETDLFTTRSGEEATISWQSDPRMNYTIIYSTSMSGPTKWRVLPGHDYIRGTGGMISYKDKVPLGENRIYRLIIEPAMKR